MKPPCRNYEPLAYSERFTEVWIREIQERGLFINIYKILFFISGDYEVLEQIRQAEEELEYSLSRKKKKPGRDAELRNLLFLKLGQWERSYNLREKEENLVADKEVFAIATTSLQRITSLLAPIDRSRYKAELTIQVTCGLGNAGLALPVEFLTAVSDTGFPLGISILALPEEEDQGGS